MLNKTNVNLSLTGLDIFDEFEGSELETKIEYHPRKPNLLIRLLKREIKIGGGFLFKLVPNKEEILTWTYYFDRYGCKNGHNFIEAYSLIYHPEKEKFWIKVKGLPKNSRGENLLVRKEDIIRVERKMTDQDADLILQLKKLETGREIIFLGTIKRDKVYLLLQNSQTGRYYSVSADRCHYKKSILSQVEIEYKGIERAKIVEMGTALLKKLVSQEISMLSEFLIKNLGGYFTFRRTKQTKFEWLCSCLIQEKSR